MYLIDRYVLRLFLKSLLVCFCSFTGLYIVIDAFGNLEEFLEYTEKLGAQVFFDYYAPRVCTFFDRTSSMLTLIAAIFAVTWMQRTNELTAILAAGIPKARVVKPLLIASVVVSLLGVFNRELVIPQVRDRLTRNAQNWLGEQDRQMTPQFDFQTRILFTGRSTRADEQRIESPSFQLPDQFIHFGETITGKSAQFQPADALHPAGYLVSQVTVPADLDERPSVFLDSQPVVLTPHDTSWLASGECFVVSQISFEELASGREYRQYSSTLELIQALRNPSLDYGAATRVLVHARIVQPLLDITILLLGLPLVTGRNHSNMFVAAGLCLLVVAGFFLTSLVCQSLGGYVLLKPPSLAAWLPVMIFVPLAYAIFRRGWD